MTDQYKTITAAEAESLGAGNSEWRYIMWGRTGDWIVSDEDCSYCNSGYDFEYRTKVKETNHFESIVKSLLDTQVKLGVAPSTMSLLKEYEAQVATPSGEYGVLDDFVWKYRSKDCHYGWTEENPPPKTWMEQIRYHEWSCTPKPTTTVNDKKMTIEKSKKLFEETRLTHDWYVGDSGDSISDWSSLGFKSKLPYSYKLKPKMISLRVYVDCSRTSNRKFQQNERYAQNLVHCTRWCVD